MLKLDLHGIRHKDVKHEVGKFLDQNWNSGQELEIITGNSDEMKRIVGEVLDRYGLDYCIGRENDLLNKGYIVTFLD